MWKRRWACRATRQTVMGMRTKQTCMRRTLFQSASTTELAVRTKFLAECCTLLLNNTAMLDMLEVRQSGIVEGGKGVFATRTIEKGVYACPYGHD